MHVLIVVNSLQQGGSERASIRLAEALEEDGHTLTLATWNSNRDFYSLNSKIKRLDLGNFFETRKYKIGSFSYNFIKIGLARNLFSYRRAILRQNPDVVICFEALIGSITGLSLIGSRMPLIISERINPNPDVYKPHWIAQRIRPWIFKTRAICSVQTEGFAEWVKSQWHLSPAITPNHIPNEWINNSNAPIIKNRNIVSIGRINHQKGYDILIQAWNQLGDKTKDWVLEIYGREDDPVYGEILRKTAPKNVVFHDATANIIEVLDNSFGFISSSRYEGFPNIVLESLARGTPTVASFSSDIVNLLHDQGALIGYDPEDVNALSDNISSLILDIDTASRLKEKSREIALNYTWTSVGKSWYEAIELAFLQQRMNNFRKIVVHTKALLVHNSKNN